MKTQCSAWHESSRQKWTKQVDCEQSLFSQSSLSSAGLERANWPRGKLERGASSPASPRLSLASLDFLARVTILRDRSQSTKQEVRFEQSTAEELATLATKRELKPKSVLQLFLGILTSDASFCYWPIFPLPLVTVPEVLAKVNSVQFPSRFCGKVANKKAIHTMLVRDLPVTDRNRLSVQHL